MFIKRIKINKFRNIDNAVIEPGKNINYIIGSNAQGKTSLVEAIYTVSLLKSFRTNNIDETIKDKASMAEIEVLIDNNCVENIIKFKYGKKNKICELNGKKPESNKFYSYLNTIIFHPEEVNYIGNYPLYRRNLLDRSIFLSDYNYIDTIKNYNRCLKQRNILLKSKSENYDCWKNQLIKYGAQIIKKRLNYLEEVNNFFVSDLFKKICDEKYNIEYSNNYTDIANIENFLDKQFINKKEREFYLGYTLVGPHRDDINFFINNKSANKYSSQGQKRSLIISFKTAQINIYRKNHGFFPILILDDMNSELDSNRKNVLVQNILNNSGQTFITSTDITNINIISGSKIFKVANGVVSSAE